MAFNIVFQIFQEEFELSFGFNCWYFFHDAWYVFQRINVFGFGLSLYLFDKFFVSVVLVKDVTKIGYRREEDELKDRHFDVFDARK